ncbi:MAG: putative Na+-driven multidrug efflux pump [Myxococcaceae bacterium]|nr:putative Na+-driven multidrug efflux pump [Myxococcaceae bacterium]
MTSTPPGPWLDREKAARILRLAAPVILAMLTQTGVNIVDTYFIGQLPRGVASDGQAALTPSLMFLWAVGGFLSSISVGTLATTARRFGEGKALEAGAVLPNAAVVAIVGGVVGTVVGWLALPWAFSLLVDNPNVVALGVGYARWRFFGIASMAATAAYKSFYDGVGKTHLHLYAALAMNVVNGLLCWVLIFGRYGAPRMGVSGAGVAACVSSWIGLLVMVLFSLRREDRARYDFYRKAVLSWTLMKQLLKLSVPGGVATAAVMAGFLLFTRVVASIDRDAMLAGATASFNGTATTIIIEVLSMTFVSCLAFGTATATLVGQSMGRNDPDLAERYAWTSVKLAVLIFGAMGLLMFAYPAAVLGAFSKEAPVIAVGVVPMKIMALMGPVIATAMILTQALFGAGETRFVMIAELGLHFFCLVPLAWLLGKALGLGLVGVWLAAAVYGVALALLMGVKFSRGGWKKLTV